MRRAAWLPLVFWIAACASRPKPEYMERADERVQVVDTLPEFLATTRAELDTGRVQDAWLAYQERHRALLEAAGALPEDPGNERLVRLLASADAILALVERFAREAPAELEKLEERLEELGPVPRVTVALAVAIPGEPLLRGTHDGRPLVLLNARHPDLAAPTQRQALIARELFMMQHLAQQPPTGVLGPLARQVYREGAASFATRQLAPEAAEHHVLAIPERRLEDARRREQLIAKELLASFDSASAVEAARFFDPDLADPLVPRGAGQLIADRLYQRLAAELKSVTRPLQLSPPEFAQRARGHLRDLAAGR